MQKNLTEAVKGLVTRYIMSIGQIYNIPYIAETENFCAVKPALRVTAAKGDEKESTGKKDGRNLSPARTR
jgi:hypothetical protein